MPQDELYSLIGSVTAIPERRDGLSAGARPQAESPPIQGLANGRVDGLYCHGPRR